MFIHICIYIYLSISISLSLSVDKHALILRIPISVLEWFPIPISGWLNHVKTNFGWFSPAISGAKRRGWGWDDSSYG